MASWMALVTSRDIDACVLLLLLLLLLLLRGSGVGRTKTSMCLGVATAHAGYLPGSQGAIAGARAAGSPCGRTGAVQRQGGQAEARGRHNMNVFHPLSASAH